jgi:hypothetical protein
VARLLRAQSQVSLVRHPAVVDPAVVFPGPSRTLVAVTAGARRGNDAYTAHYKLRPPTVLAAPPAPFMPDPVKVAKAPSSRLGTAPHSVLREPAVVDPPVVFPGPTATLVTILPDLTGRRTAHSKLRKPTVVAASIVFDPVVTDLYLSGAQERAELRQPHSRLRPPTVLDPSIVFRPVSVELSPRTTVERDQRAVRSRLYPPTVVDAAPATSLPPYRSYLAAEKTAASLIRREPLSILRKPAVVGAAVVFPSVPTYYRVSGRVIPDTLERRSTFYVLRPPPKIIGAAVVFQPVKVTLDAIKTAVDFIRRSPRSKLRTPTVVGPFVPVVTTDLTAVTCDSLTPTGPANDALTAAATTCDPLTPTATTNDTLTPTGPTNDTLTPTGL